MQFQILPGWTLGAGDARYYGWRWAVDIGRVRVWIGRVGGAKITPSELAELLDTREQS